MNFVSAVLISYAFISLLILESSLGVKTPSSSKRSSNTIQRRDSKREVVKKTQIQQRGRLNPTYNKPIYLVECEDICSKPSKGFHNWCGLCCQKNLFPTGLYVEVVGRCMRPSWYFYIPVWCACDTKFKPEETS